MAKFAVFGNPIAQSQSPIIHQLFAAQCNVSLTYERRLGSEKGFESELEDFFSDSYSKGANITMPFKNRAAAWADKVSPEVDIVGAANTLVKQTDGSIVAHNTDGIGLVNDLTRISGPLFDKRIMVIGAGGAAQGAILPLLDEKPTHIHIANRTVSKAQNLVDSVNDSRLSASDLGNIDFVADIIINSTSASLSGGLPEVADDVLAQATLAYDMVYSAQPTSFVSHCRRLGIEKTSDGFGMLVGQAAQSFYLWHGIQPNIEKTIEQLKA